MIVNHKLQMKWDVRLFDKLYYTLGAFFTTSTYFHEGWEAALVFFGFLVSLEIVCRHVEYKLHMRREREKNRNP